MTQLLACLTAKCSCCDREIKKVVLVDGLPYGADCAKKARAAKYKILSDAEYSKQQSDKAARKVILQKLLEKRALQLEQATIAGDRMMRCIIRHHQKQIAVKLEKL